ncbi:facilitated trehalose transporter Tret1-2 homolog isoform X2 [Eurosta solidaginis]|uniref:facilitated trehalose transporter Tret1-2 homolog isoform X2 n=1 Tax=Eurosta solidaginis TaxID=178769 RepID=UPI0035311A07
MFAFGYCLGWFSLMLPKLQSPTETSLTFVLTLNDGSWMAGLTALGAGFGSIAFGVLADRIGRKACLYILAIPLIASWIMVYYTYTVNYLLGSRFVVGLSTGGAFVIIPLFIGEISDPKIRGCLSSFFSLSFYIGAIFGYVTTPRLSYHLLALVGVALGVIYLISQMIFPETPMYLLQCGQESRAMESLKFYRNYQPTHGDTIKEFEHEFDSMKEAVNEQTCNKEHLTWRDFCNKRARRAFGNGFVLMLLNVFCGASAMLHFTASIFDAARTPIHRDTNSLIVGCIQVTGVYIATILVDTFGRKPLLIFSAGATCIGMTMLGAYDFLLQNTYVNMSEFSAWLPLANVCIIMFVVNVGLMPIPFVMLVELMPPKFFIA